MGCLAKLSQGCRDCKNGRERLADSIWKRRMVTVHEWAKELYVGVVIWKQYCGMIGYTEGLAVDGGRMG